MDVNARDHPRRPSHDAEHDHDHDAASVGASDRQSQDQEPPRKRARLSCNTCKARKTKASKTRQSGTCQYCMSLGIPCEADPKSRKRPFYRVSGDVYEYSIKLLRRFVPEEELPDLTVENIQSVLQKLEHTGNSNGNSNMPPGPRQHLALTAGSPARHDDGMLHAHNDTGTHHAPADRARSHEVMEPDDHPLLQEESGCMLLDSMGKYRYVGADSSIRWNHAARTAGDPSSTHASNLKIIPPLKTGLLPPTTPEGTGGSCRGKMYLPPRALCMTYAARFFDQIHCIYWFYSSEQFYTRLDHTLEDGGTTASASWLCALYAILAMGSTRPASTREAWVDAKTSLEYLAMARDLSIAATDEADIDSIKAFGLLSLATHATCYSVTAYLHLGTAVRIGFSLGLHRDVSPKSRDSLEREWGRRLWWTIYILDHEMASRFGYPCSVVDDAVYMRTPPATEQILDPGPNTPLGFQALFVTLVQLRKRISHECFLEPAQIGGRLPISRVTSCLAALKAWQASVPTHLRWDSSLHPQHRRAVSLLHLRYWTSIISITRPFLLFTVTHAASTHSLPMIPAKRMLYEQMSATCIEGAEAGVMILRGMRAAGTLSSLILLDCHCIGEVMWILIHALQKHGGKERQGMLRFCLETLKGMEMVGWCEKVAPELEARVLESGVLDAEGEEEVGTGVGMGMGMGMVRGEETGREWHGLVLTFHRNIDGLQFDVFETLDFNARHGGLTDMDMFMDASFSGGSQFMCNNMDGGYQP
ncbi:fungal-specific transcription factor domain-containing protein [Cercophora scortea]|uniref:Fungal-specific transcription factor domain-containing protein n=1 Tax=Cercophora scortea TaxID=314031 RepID=A0AAE0IDK6_9PEZI|nr:fungal-specific transcription factor domain-containing protein [Cercophora scortea]